ncbi:MAG: AraC family transcriptional regulator [Gammaproteobacteria bacterium]|nr:AraC family transcriptional regulator [Gammaproteobacteria bacterium]
MIMILKLKFIILALLLAYCSAYAADNKTQALDTRIEDLKKQILELNRDLFQLEEELLFPANTQFSIFVSFEAGTFFALDSVQIRLDNKVVANHLYTDREVSALKRGGTQRIYTGNLASGEHEIVAYFTGIGPKGRDYKRGSTIKLTKGTETQFIELKIADDSKQQQPEFKIKVWD